MNVLDFGEAVEFVSPRFDNGRRALDSVTRREGEVADRAYELELELTVEQLGERLRSHGLHDTASVVDDILQELAQKELEEKGMRG